MLRLHSKTVPEEKRKGKKRNDTKASTKQKKRRCNGIVLSINLSFLAAQRRLEDGMLMDVQLTKTGSHSDVEAKNPPHRCREEARGSQ